MKDIKAGVMPPKEMNAIIEVPENGFVKYEFDKETGFLKVDRIINTPVMYPTNYGFFPSTLGGDGDPIDCLVLTKAPLMPGVLIEVRPIGALMMKDQAGMDEKILCVPKGKVEPFYSKISSWKDLPEVIIKKIEYFFAHYKDLDSNAWSEVSNWVNTEEAEKLIMESIERYQNKK